MAVVAWEHNYHGATAALVEVFSESGRSASLVERRTADGVEMTVGRRTQKTQNWIETRPDDKRHFNIFTSSRSIIMRPTLPNDSSDTVREEYCRSCDRPTLQRVTIELRQECSDDATRSETRKYSRGPYRLTECLCCEELTAERIDNR